MQALCSLPWGYSMPHIPDWRPPLLEGKGRSLHATAQLLRSIPSSGRRMARSSATSRICSRSRRQAGSLPLLSEGQRRAVRVPAPSGLPSPAPQALGKNQTWTVVVTRLTPGDTRADRPTLRGLGQHPLAAEGHDRPRPHEARQIQEGGCFSAIFFGEEAISLLSGYK